MKWILFLLLPLISFSQDYNVDEFAKLSKEKQDAEIQLAINNFEDSRLIGYLRTLDDNNFNLKPHHNRLIAKAKSLSWPIDLYNMVKILIKQQTDKPALESLLNSTIKIWDTGNWSQTFWTLIKQNKFEVPNGLFYTVDDMGKKTYNIELYLAQKQKDGELGANALLEVDNQIFRYSSGNLLNVLLKFDICQIAVIPKSESIGLFGKAGIDGMIQVLTRKD